MTTGALHRAQTAGRPAARPPLATLPLLLSAAPPNPTQPHTPASCFLLHACPTAPNHAYDQPTARPTYRPPATPPLLLPHSLPRLLHPSFTRLSCDAPVPRPGPARPVLRPRQPARLAGQPHATSLQSVDLSGGWPAVRRVPASMGLHFDNMCGFGAAVQARASTPAPARALDPPASTCCCHVHRLPHPPPAAATAAAAAQQPAADQAIGGEDVPKLTRTTL